MGDLFRRGKLAFLLAAACGPLFEAGAFAAALGAAVAETGTESLLTSEAVKPKRRAKKKRAPKKPAAAAEDASVPEGAPAQGDAAAPEGAAAPEAVEPGPAPAKAKKRRPAKKGAKKGAGKSAEKGAERAVVFKGEDAPETAAPAAETKAAAKKAAPEEPDETARISRYTGVVEVRSAGQKQWRELTAPGTEIRTGDRVNTYGDSSATAEFHEGSKVEISPFSMLGIEKDKFDHIAVGLYQGKISAQVSWRAKRRFEVRASGAAVVAKASEKFTVSATSDRRVRVEVESGEVSVFAVGARKLVKAREGVSIEGGRMGPVEVFGPAFTAPPREEPAEMETTPDDGAGGGAKARPAAPAGSLSGAGPSSRPAFRAEAEREVSASLSRDYAESAAAFDVRAAQYQEGRVLMDAGGSRVRVEEYVTRPDPKSFKIVTLNSRGRHFDYGTLQVEANAVLPSDLAEAGDLFYSPTAAKPVYWAVKYLWTQSNLTDTVTRLGVDGDALAVTLVPAPVFDPSAGAYAAPSVKAAHQTLFGNVYEFSNGGDAGIKRIYSDASFRPADNGTTAGTAVSGMLARLQPVQVSVRDVAVPATVLATYYDYSFVTLDPTDGSGNATGKAEVVSYGMPAANRFQRLLRYVDFRDTNGDGVLDFAEGARAGEGCLYGDCSVAAVFHDRVSRRNGTVDVSLPGAGCQGTDAGCISNAGDTQFFADTDNDGVIDLGEASVVGVTGYADPALLAFAAASPRAWLEEEHVVLDDFGAAASFADVTSPGRDTAGYNAAAEFFERGVFERSVTGSMFPGGKLDLVMVPSLHLAAGLVSGESSGSGAPAAGNGNLVR